jgi:DNA-binding cell septation regulator SpoVG
VTAIEVRDVERSTDPASKVKLTATVVLGGVAVKFVKLIEGQRGSFVGLPARKIDEEFVDVVELSDSLRGRVREALLVALTQPVETSDDALPF